MKKIFIFLFVFVVVSCNTKDVAVQDTSLKIGDKGPGGGLVFHIEGKYIWEVSKKLGSANWEEAKTMCKNYHGGGFRNWYLPTNRELNWVYEGLVTDGKILSLDTTDWHWSSWSGYNENMAWAQNFFDGEKREFYKESTMSVRAIRIFDK